LIAIGVYNNFSGMPALPVFSARAPQCSGPLEQALNIVLLFVVVAVINGEELAWRGFALPRLQSKYNALTSSIILGVIWTLFHLPLFFTLTGSSQVDRSYISFLISTISLTVLYTWMYNHTRGSVLLAYLLHASANTWSVVFSIDHTNNVIGWIMTGLLTLAAILVVIFTGAENLSRKTTRLQE
jgi:membrane protease YdiL (CAAX protease family)